MEKNIELIHLEYLKKRFVSLDSGKLKKLKNLTRGYQGEADFYFGLKNMEVNMSSLSLIIGFMMARQWSPTFL